MRYSTPKIYAKKIYTMGKALGGGSVALTLVFTSGPRLFNKNLNNVE